MSISSGIEWTDSTWNPIRGCTRDSEGCRNCYAERMAYRFSGPGQPYEGLVTLKNGHPSWTGAVSFVDRHILDPIRWRPVIEHTPGCQRDWESAVARWKAVGGKRPRRRFGCDCPSRRRIVFVNSVSDLFHESVPAWWQDQIFAVMAMCQDTFFIALTKRAKRMHEYLTAPANELQMRWGVAASHLLGSGEVAEKRAPKSFPLPNVALGVSIEDQDTANRRVPYLLLTPAAFRLVSAEPLLGPVDLTAIRYHDHVAPEIECEWNALTAFHQVLHSQSMDAVATEDDGVTKLDMVICGGESGQNARPMHPIWPRRLRDDCVGAGTPFFFKQWGEWGPCENGEVTPSPQDWEKPPQSHEFHDDDCPRCAWEVVYRVGKKAAGDLLDGKQWHQYPQSFLHPEGDAVVTQ